MEAYSYQQSPPGERSSSMLRNVNYWKNSSWKTLDKASDFSLKFMPSHLFTKKVHSRNDTAEKSFTTPYADSFEITPSKVSLNGAQPVRSFSVKKQLYSHFDKNLTNEFDSMLRAKMRRIGMVEDKRSRSVQRNSDKLMTEIVNYAKSLKPTKIKIRKFPRSLPKLRPNIKNKPPGNDQNCSAEETDESEMLPEDNSKILIMPNVVGNDLPDIESLISQLKSKKMKESRKVRKVKPIYTTYDPTKDEEATKKRLLIEQGPLKKNKADNSIKGRQEKFLKVIDDISQNMYPEILNDSMPMSRKFELVKMRCDAKARAISNCLSKEIDEFKEFAQKNDKKKKSKLDRKNSFVKRMAPEQNVINVTACIEEESEANQTSFVDRNMSFNTNNDDDLFFMRRKSFNPELVNRLNSQEPNLYTKSKFSRKVTSQLSVDGSFTRNSNQKSPSFKDNKSSQHENTAKPQPVLYGKAAMDMRRKKLQRKKELKRLKKEKEKLDKERQIKLQQMKEQMERLKYKNSIIINEIKQSWSQERQEVEQRINQLDNITENNLDADSESVQDEEFKASQRISLKKNIFNKIVKKSNTSSNRDSDTTKNRSSQFFLTQENFKPELKKEISTNSQDDKNDVKILEKELTNEVYGKKEFFQVVKNVLKRGVFTKILDKKHPENQKKSKYTKGNVKNKLAQMKFIQKCKEENVLAVPVINKLKDKKLILENYRMNEGLAKALEAAIEELAEYLEVLALKSNDMNDASLASIIKGVCTNPYVTTIKIENNKLEEESAKSLKILLNEFDEDLGKRKKSHIESISLHDCFMRPMNAEILTSSLPDNRTIKELVLTTVKLTNLSIKNICTFICENYKKFYNNPFSLKKLDLSWNEIVMSDLQDLTEAIGSVTNIQFLSLAAVPFSGPNNLKMVANLSTILRKSLVHCDLSGCNLSHKCCLILAKAMRYSRTLVAIHLSANNMSPLTKSEMEDISTGKSSEKKGSDIINTFLTMIKKSSSDNYKIKASIQRQKRLQRTSATKENDGVKGTIDDRVVFKRILGHIEIQGSHKWAMTNRCWVCEKWNYSVIIVNKMIANKFMSKRFDQYEYRQTIENSRKREEMAVVGNTPEISGKFSSWEPRKMMPIFDYCEYISRNGLPSTRFYVEADGSMYNKLARAFTRDIQLIMRKKFCLKKVEKPMVYKIRDAIIAEKKAKEEEEQKILEEIKKAQKIEKKVTENSGSDFNKDLKIESSKNIEKVEDVKAEAQLEENSDDDDEEKFSFEKWMEIVRKYLVKEKAIQVFNLKDISKLHYHSYSLSKESMKSDHFEKEKLIESNNLLTGAGFYVFSDYLPPARHEFCVNLQPNSASMDDFYHLDFVVPFRDGEYKVKEKCVKKRMILHKFIKRNSVFKAWKEDTHDRLLRAFELDMAHSKISKFTGPKEIYEEVTDLLYRHTSKIKDLFTYGIGNSSFPSISWLDFCDMCKAWKIVDKNLNFSTIDRVFIVTNFEEVEQEDNPDRDLCRYEFYEIIARLAREKYFNTKICNSLASAIDKFLEDIYAQCEHYWSWQKWREEKLWTFRVDDLLKANLPALKKVYKSYHNQVKKWMDLDDVEDLMVRAMPEVANTAEKAKTDESKFNEKLKSAEKGKGQKEDKESFKPKNIVVLSYCYCKMTVVDEMGGDKDNYDKLEFVEFLEFIGRIANTLEPLDPKNRLVTKIEKVLEKIFALFGEKVKPAESNVEAYSESDSEPYKH
ncbi:unnamed protein product [Moneuplotes crassus]|uniref:Uncharacterized protein n=1 Tax=Euplotes crassus TaxID=5936 RepID=A0AAD1XZ56_EUPCR|nr:unnamed protein product [Moneuplotes crassus]